MSYSIGKAAATSTQNCFPTATLSIMVRVRRAGTAEAVGEAATMTHRRLVRRLPSKTLVAWKRRERFRIYLRHWAAFRLSLDLMLVVPLLRDQHMVGLLRLAHRLTRAATRTLARLLVLLR